LDDHAGFPVATIHTILKNHLIRNLTPLAYLLGSAISISL
jgi:hypothetical protein